jgi:serine/threonine protein phosphatase PrpC
MACPQCGSDVAADDRYCEACGCDLLTGAALPLPGDGAALLVPSVAGAGGPGAPANGASAVAGVVWRSSTAVVGVNCPGCGGIDFDAEGYCNECGKRRPGSAEHAEIDLDVIAAVTDIGKRHHRNEDAVAIGLIPGYVVGIVCDGVSSSNRPDDASHAAVDAAMPAMIEVLVSPGTTGAEPAADRVPVGDGLDGAATAEANTLAGLALLAAARAAQAAAVLAGGADPGPNPPSCTFVAAVVDDDEVTVGWIGDSRAYWVPDAGTQDNEAACLTTDDSLGAQLAAAGVPMAGEPRGPAAALIRWLGADARDTEAHLVTLRPTAPGRVLVCSDGLFKYRPVAAELAALTPTGAPLDVARELVTFALDSGGHDNVSVAVLPFPAPRSQHS